MIIFDVSFYVILIVIGISTISAIVTSTFIELKEEVYVYEFCIVMYITLYTCMYTRNYFTNVTGFAKRGLVDASNLSTLRRCNSACR